MWENDMWFIVAPTLICCVTKADAYSIPCVAWGFVYAQGKDGSEWRHWNGPSLSSSPTFGYDGMAGDLSNPPSSVSDFVSTKQIQVNLSSGQTAQADNVWCIRNIQAITLDEGAVKVTPNFKSVGTVTRHNTDGRRLMYFAHNTTLPSGTYPGIYNMYFVLLPRGCNRPNWRGIADKESLQEDFNIGIAIQYDEADIQQRQPPVATTQDITKVMRMAWPLVAAVVRIRVRVTTKAIKRATRTAMQPGWRPLEVMMSIHSTRQWMVLQSFISRLRQHL